MEKFRWEDPSIFKINKEDGHAIMMPYDSENEALSGKESKYKQSLNGKWKFYWQRGLKNQPENFQLVSFDDSHWDEINVPSVWQTEGYSVPYYYASTFPKAFSRTKSKIPSIDHNMQEIGFYRKTFVLDEVFDNREVFLHFGAAKSALEVYVNGEFVGYSQGSMAPHEFDITKVLKKGENVITAKLYRFSDGSYLEDQDMWWLCGIYRDVYLLQSLKFAFVISILKQILMIHIMIQMSPSICISIITITSGAKLKFRQSLLIQKMKKLNLAQVKKNFQAARKQLLIIKQ